jgi:hypothetical protein
VSRLDIRAPSCTAMDAVDSRSVVAVICQRGTPMDFSVLIKSLLSW